MRNKILFSAVLPLFLLAALTLTIININVTSQTSTKAQSGPSVYWGAFIDNPADIGSFEATVGKTVSLIPIFHAWIAGNFPTGTLDMIRNHGAIPVISWESYNSNDADTTSWQRISEGSMDSYIAQWAQDSKSWGHPYFLRFDWEMNGFWNPYAKQSDAFIPMWKHVHDIFIQNGATNVTWVWCPNTDGEATQPLEKFYPGNDYVDWVCMDSYNAGTTQSWSHWNPFAYYFSPTYNHLLSLAPGKPIMVGETGTTEQGGSKADWIRTMLTEDLPNNFPSVKAFLWFDINKETDWRIESSAGSQLAFTQSIASAYYAGNQFGGLATSPIPYLGSLSSRPAAAIVATKVPTPSPTSTLTTTPPPTINPSITIEAPCQKALTLCLSKNTESLGMVAGICILGGIILLRLPQKKGQGSRKKRKK